MAVPITTPSVDPIDDATDIARALLRAQDVAPGRVEATARALGLLLAGSGSGAAPNPVVIASEIAARICEFDPRTWWIVKRRLLALGHLVGAAGDGPRGRLGGRGRQGAYCVSPETFRQFLEAKRAGRDARHETLMRARETVMQTVMRPEKTLMSAGKTLMPRAGRRSQHSQHRLSSLPLEKTSDVFQVLEGRTTESADTEGIRPEADRLEAKADGSQTARTERVRDPREQSHHKSHQSFSSPRSPAKQSHHKSHQSFSSERSRELPGERSTLSNELPAELSRDRLTWLGEEVLASRRRSPASSRRSPREVSKTATGAPSVRTTSATASAGAATVETAASERAARLAGESLSSREIARLFEREPDAHVRLALVRLLERVIVFERGLDALSPLDESCDDASSSDGASSGDGDRPSDARDPVKTPNALAKTVNTPETSPAQAPASVSAIASAHAAPVSAPSEPVRRGAATKIVERSAARRARAPHPLWSPDDEGEKRATFAHVGAILELANREFGASFDLERSRRDTLLYSYEVVRGAVANVLLKRARGYKFENPGAVLWDAITVPGYRLEEFAVANLEEVLKRCAGAWTPPVPVATTAVTTPAALAPPAAALAPPAAALAPPAAALTPPAPTHASRAREGPSDHARERRRIEARRLLYESLSADARAELDRRARETAREGFLARGTPLDEAVFGLRVLRARDDILEREHASALATHEQTLTR